MPDHDIADAVKILRPHLEKKRLIIFAGSGVSVPAPAKLPTWDKFLEDFIAFCDDVEEAHAPDKDVQLLNDAKTEAARYPARVASALRNRLEELENQYSENFDNAFGSWLRQEFSSSVPNDYHRIITATDYPVILTSNYDELFEKAARDGGYRTLWLNSYSFNDSEKLASALYEGRGCIIHAHGNLKDVALENFVFTAEDYQAIMKKKPGFRLAIESLFLRYSIVFVGYGASDPHFEDLVEEVSMFLDWSCKQELPRYFLVLKKDKASRVLSKYKDKMRTELILYDDHDQAKELLCQLRDVAPRDKG
jgi:hypothetical protein